MVHHLCSNPPFRRPHGIMYHPLLIDCAQTPTNNPYSAVCTVQQLCSKINVDCGVIIKNIFEMIVIVVIILYILPEDYNLHDIISTFDYVLIIIIIIVCYMLQPLHKSQPSNNGFTLIKQKVQFKLNNIRVSTINIAITLISK